MPPRRRNLHAGLHVAPPVADARDTDLGENCPNASEHRHAPAGYIAASAWANRMMHGHIQRKCAGCDRWLIWVPLAEATAAERAEWRRDVKPYLVEIDGDVAVAND